MNDQSLSCSAFRSLHHFLSVALIGLFSFCANLVGQDLGGISGNLVTSKVLPARDLEGLPVPEQTISIRSENGWIVVSLVTSPNVLEWEVVLAKKTKGNSACH